MLNASQYNNFVRLVNDIDGEGRVSGDLGFDPDDTLLNALKEKFQIQSLGIFLPTDEDNDALNNILTVRRSKARERTINSTQVYNI